LHTRQCTRKHNIEPGNAFPHQQRPPETGLRYYLCTVMWMGNPLLSTGAYEPIVWKHIFECQKILKQTEKKNEALPPIRTRIHRASYAPRIQNTAWRCGYGRGFIQLGSRGTSSGKGEHHHSIHIHRPKVSSQKQNPTQFVGSTR
jgi:hypothetical protein